MKKEYKYSNLKQETNTSGKVMLEPSKKTKKRKPGIKQESLRSLVLKLSDEMHRGFKKQEEFNKRQEEFNKQVLSRLDNLVKKNNLEE
ncbi:MAG: hypothetical protein K2L48_02605 [Mycoplasmoidaceae bacterium]|nr:hypothetical protein [Mycoplasmoidaceae bacterium]